MAILTGVGISQLTNSISAIDEAYAQAALSMDQHEPSCIILFASSLTYNQQELVSHLKGKLANTVIIGCSTSGEITSVAGSMDNSIGLIAFYSDQMRFVPGVGKNIAADPRDAGKQLANDIQRNANGEKPKAMIMLPDGLAGNGADIVRGVLDVFGSDFMVVGGSAGDDFQFKKTFQYYNDQVLSGDVVGIGLYGDFNYGIGVRHGWIPIGVPRIATRSKGNILYELDNKPAVQLYEDYFGKDKNPLNSNEPFARLAITYPLGISVPTTDGYLIRDPLSFNEQGAITLAAEVPEGSEVHIMIGSTEEAIEAARDAAQQAIKQSQGKTIKAIILFNCIARKKLLMTKKQEEIDKIREIIGKDIPLIGFYTYGEQAPLGEEIATCSFHNETDVIFVIAE